MRAWLISFRWQLFLIRKAVRIQAAFVACAFETSLKLCSTLYTQEVHSEQPCVCETWHIQSTEGHDFRQSISQTTITYTHLHPGTVGRSTNSKISALFIMFKLGQFECHEIEKCSQNWDYCRVWGPSTNFHCDRTHNCTCTRFLLLLLLFFVCCFIFGFFAFRYEHEKKSYSHDAVAIRSVNRIEVIPQPQPDNQMS